MTKQPELPKLLEQLRGELAEHPPLDARTADALRALMVEIQEALQSGTAEKPSGETPAGPLAGRLQEMLADFEVRHPQATATLSSLVERLTDLGI